MKNNNNNIIIYQAKNGALELRGDRAKETMWANLDQIAKLFGRDKSVISRHIKKIYGDNELKARSVVAFFATTASDGKTYNVEYFNLDMILSVGYRVNSVQATNFRQWATKVLRSHIVDGYTLNEKRLKSGGNGKYLELRKAVDLLGNLVALESVSGETRGVVQVISEYARALDLLDDYDYQRLTVPKGMRREAFAINYAAAREVIEAMRTAYGGSSLMGREKDKGLHSALGALYQTFGGKDVYPTVEEKAAHLLYFITKNHAFIDGNKRIAAALFVYYLEKNGQLVSKQGERRITDTTLVALTLLIASSKPQEKDVMIKVILNLMHG